MLWQALRIVTEPGGAAAFAALISGRYKPGSNEHSHVFAERRGRDFELVCDQKAADAIIDEVTIHLRPEVRSWVFEPLQDLKSPLVRQSFKDDHHIHISSLQIS